MIHLTFNKKTTAASVLGNRIFILAQLKVSSRFPIIRNIYGETFKKHQIKIIIHDECRLKCVKTIKYFLVVILY